MRPRLYTAENDRHADERARRIVASMRPRLYTAENSAWPASAMEETLASMRPRLYTAENMEETLKCAKKALLQ